MTCDSCCGMSVQDLVTKYRRLIVRLAHSCPFMSSGIFPSHLPPIYHGLQSEVQIRTRYGGWCLFRNLPQMAENGQQRIGGNGDIAQTTTAYPKSCPISMREI